jgi:hypothetical protein
MGFKGGPVFVGLVEVHHVGFPFGLPYVEPQRTGLTVSGHLGVPSQVLEQLGSLPVFDNDPRKRSVHQAGSSGIPGVATNTSCGVSGRPASVRPR